MPNVRTARPTAEASRQRSALLSCTQTLRAQMNGTAAELFPVAHSAPSTLVGQCTAVQAFMLRFPV